MASQADACYSAPANVKNSDNTVIDTKEEKQTVSWSNYEVLALLNIWADVEIQGQLDGMRRNKKVYNRISEMMASRGFVRSFVQCRNKIKWLKHEYKRVADNNNRYVHI